MKYSRRRFMLTPALLIQNWMQPGTLPPPPLPTPEEAARHDSRQDVEISIILWMIKVHSRQINEIQKKFVNTGWWKPRKYRPT